MISIIIPVLNEPGIVSFLYTLQKQAGNFEIIVVDGDPKGSTVSLINQHYIHNSLSTNLITLVSPRPGRAAQMNVGASHAKWDILLFLHADTRLPKNGLRHITRAIKRRRQVAGGFRLSIYPNSFSLAIISFFANCRSKLRKLLFGDQAFFIRKDIFQKLGGFADLPFLEDVELCQRVRGIYGKQRIALLSKRVRTSARRWQKDGVIKRTLLNWKIVWRYNRGASPWKLRELYK